MRAGSIHKRQSRAAAGKHGSSKAEQAHARRSNRNASCEQKCRQLQCRRGPRMRESIAKETGALKEKNKNFLSGDLGTGTRSRKSRRVKMSTGRADLEVDEDREDPELRLRCRRRRPGRATGKHRKQREGKERHASRHQEESCGPAQPKKSKSFGTGSRTEPEPSEPAAAVSDSVPLRAGQTNPIKARNLISPFCTFLPAWCFSVKLLQNRWFRDKTFDSQRAER